MSDTTAAMSERRAEGRCSAFLAPADPRDRLPVMLGSCRYAYGVWGFSFRHAVQCLILTASLCANSVPGTHLQGRRPSGPHPCSRHRETAKMDVPARHFDAIALLLELFCTFGSIATAQPPECHELAMEREGSNASTSPGVPHVDPTGRPPSRLPGPPPRRDLGQPFAALAAQEASHRGERRDAKTTVQTRA